MNNINNINNIAKRLDNKVPYLEYLLGFMKACITLNNNDNTTDIKNPKNK